MTWPASHHAYRLGKHAKHVAELMFISLCGHIHAQNLASCTDSEHRLLTEPPAISTITQTINLLHCLHTSHVEELGEQREI